MSQISRDHLKGLELAFALMKTNPLTGYAAVQDALRIAQASATAGQLQGQQPKVLAYIQFGDMPAAAHGDWVVVANTDDVNDLAGEGVVSLELMSFAQHEHTVARIEARSDERQAAAEELARLLKQTADEVRELRAAISAPSPSEVPAGVYAIHYLDNWDGQGDRYFAIAHKYPDGRWLFEESGKELLQYEGDKILRVWPLSAASPAPGGPEVREAVATAIAEALGEALDCTRVWSAWGAGTMSEEDFHQVADDPERVAEIADAAIAAMANAALTPSDGRQEAWEKAAMAEWCALDFTKMSRREMTVFIGHLNFKISHLQRIVDAKASKQPAAPANWCKTMERPKSKCGCPDCGSSLVQVEGLPAAPAQGGKV